MSIFDEHSSRQVVPLWRDSSELTDSAELQPLVGPSNESLFARNVPGLIDEFRRAPSLGVALDLINSASVENVEGDEVFDAARVIVENKKSPRGGILLAEHILREGVAKERESGVNFLRRRLHIYPHDAVGWADLARHYASNGRSEKAVRAMQVALEVSGQNRWVTRVAARLYVHMHEADRAYALLNSHVHVKVDPWLLAAELATAQLADISPSHWKNAVSLAASDIAPKHLSELAGAMATFELRSGGNKRAKRLFRQSLLAPTGNSLAQAQWAERTSRIQLLSERIDPIKDANEALFWQSYNSEDMEGALQYAIKWHEDEPFSSRASIMGSFVASLLDDYASVESIVAKGLRANPGNPTLRMNHIFAWAAGRDWRALSEQDLSIVENYLRELSSHAANDDFSAHACANIGLIYYRMGHASDGRKAYEYAIRKLDEARSVSAGIARLNHCREALLAGVDWGRILLEELESWIKKNAGALTPGTKFYLRRISSLAKEPAVWEEMVKSALPIGARPSPRVLIPDSRRNVRFELKDGKAIIWLP